MRTKTLNMLPKTIYEIPNGGIYRQAVRCGKLNCKCTRGEKHSAYYFFTRSGGKLFKLYIRKADLESFKQLVDAAAADRKAEHRMNRETNALIRECRQSMRDKDQIIKTLKGNIVI